MFEPTQEALRLRVTAVAEDHASHVLHASSGGSPLGIITRASEAIPSSEELPKRSLGRETPQASSNPPNGRLSEFKHVVEVNSRNTGGLLDLFTGFTV